MRVDKFILGLIIISLINLVSAQLNTGYDSDKSLTISLTKPTSPINYSTVNVNNSNFLESHPASYFYPFSNPYNYLNTTNLTNLGYAKYQFTNNNFNGSGNFTTTGRIGIGTASPDFGLHVVNNQVNITGSVGAGASSAPNVLIVTGGIGGAHPSGGTGGKGGGFILTSGVGGTSGAGDGGAGGDLELTTGAGGVGGGGTGNYGNIILVKNGGNVGIGTSAPTQKLDVNGSINATGNVTAAYFIGDGSRLNNVNVSGAALYQFTNNNFNGSGNFTTTDYGFFGWLGSLVSRITKLFINDIDVNGTIQMNQGNITNVSQLNMYNIGNNPCIISNGTFCRNNSGLYYQSGV